MDHLAHKPEVVLHSVGGPAKGPHKVKVQHIRRIQANAVDVEFRHPEPHGIAEVFLHRRIPLVQLCQQIVASPIFIRKAILVFRISAEVHAAVPVPVLGILPVLPDIPEGEEIPACMVEDPVQHHPDALAVAGRHKILEILIGAQAAVQLPVVRGIVAVGLRFKQRPDVQGIAAQLCHVVDPGKQRSQPRLGCAVVIVHRSPG